MYTSLFKKPYYFTCLITSILVVNFSPSLVHAQVVEFGPGAQGQITAIVTNSSGTAGSTAITAQAAQQAAQLKTTQDAAEAVAYAFVRNLSKKLIAMAFAELQGGASGLDHPQRFITDFAQLGNDLVTQETKVLTDAIIADSDNPYGALIGTMIINSTVNTSLNKLNTTINKIPGVDPVFASRDIGSAGLMGWDFYSQLALPQNTPVGSSQIAQDILAQNIRNAQNIKSQEITTSGYSPARKACDIDFNSSQLAPIIADLQAQVAAAQAGYDVAVADGGGVPTQTQQAIINDNKNDLDQAKAALDQAVQDQKNINTEFGLDCANATITNPKGAIESISQQAIAAPFADLQKENRWYTILSEAIQQVATGLINYGVSQVPANNVFNFE